MKRLWRDISKGIPVSTAIAIISALAAIASAFFSYNQNQIFRKQLHLHVRPEVAIGLSVFVKRDFFQPVLSIRNQSPVSIVSLSADYQFFQFDKATKRFRDQPTSSLTGEQLIQEHVLFRNKIEPNDFVAAELGSVISVSPTPKSIFVFIVFSTHYREADMERFDNRRIFFFENGKVLDQASFMANPDYDKMFPLINTVRPPDWRSPGDLPATVLHKPKAERTSAQRKTKKAENQGATRQLPAAPSGIRMKFTDD